MGFKALYVTLCVCVSNSILVPNTNSLRPRTTSIDLVVVMELDITMYLQQQCLWMSHFDLSHCGCHIADIVSHCDVSQFDMSQFDMSQCDVSHCGCHILMCRSMDEIFFPILFSALSVSQTRRLCRYMLL